jgi:2-dehydro-3-deoxyglucarate aldolase
MSRHFDWLVIDMEHSAITLDKAQDLIRIISLQGCKSLVRLRENNSHIIKQVMDAGAHGIIVPMVNSMDDAMKAYQSVHYPPTGIRGVGLARAQDYGFGFEKYKQWLKREAIVIAQIEHINGVRHLPEILNTPIDGIIIGPYDLSASLGVPGDFENLYYKEALTRILNVAKDHKKPVGIHVIPPYAKDVASLDPQYKFVAFSLDTMFFGSKIRDELDGIKEL